LGVKVGQTLSNMLESKFILKIDESYWLFLFSTRVLEKLFTAYQ